MGGRQESTAEGRGEGWGRAEQRERRMFECCLGVDCCEEDIWGMGYVVRNGGHLGVGGSG